MKLNNVLNIISSSSKGNCYIYNDELMVDIGVPYKKISGYMKDIKVILLTHFHTDHFNKTTIKKCLYEYPNTKIICCWWMVDTLLQLNINKKNIWVLELDKKYDIGNYQIEPISAIHDVPNCGYKIIIKDKDYKILHISDTSSIKHIKALNFDFASIEGNYETNEELNKKIEKDKMEGKYSHYERVKTTHLSQLQAYNWLVENKIKDYTFIHQHYEKEEI